MPCNDVLNETKDAFLQVDDREKRKVAGDDGWVSANVRVCEREWRGEREVGR